MRTGSARCITERHCLHCYAEKRCPRKLRCPFLYAMRPYLAIHTHTQPLRGMIHSVSALRSEPVNDIGFLYPFGAVSLKQSSPASWLQEQSLTEPHLKTTIYGINHAIRVV